VLRLLTYGKHEQLLPSSFLTTLEKDAPTFWKWANAVVREESVTYIWNEQKVVEGTIARLGLGKPV
jgi:glutathione S-transferase